MLTAQRQCLFFGLERRTEEIMQACSDQGPRAKKYYNDIFRYYSLLDTLQLNIDPIVTKAKPTQSNQSTLIFAIICGASLVGENIFQEA
jgi:hypothetical protein